MRLIKSLTKPPGRLISVPLDRIAASRYQPRRAFEPESLAELAESIRRHGLLQPVSLRDLGRGDYELIAGERRLRAAGLAGLAQIPAIVIEGTERDYAVLALVENLQRADLGFFEEAEGIAALLAEHDLTQEAAAEMLGKSQPTVANKLRLLKLSPAVREALTGAGLSERHARALLRLPEDLRPKVLDRMIVAGLTVAETDRLIDRLLRPGPKGRRKGVFKDVRIFFNTVNKALTIMREAGVDANAQMQERDDCYEYTIRIPKSV